MARLSGFHLKGGIGKTMLDLVYPVNSLYLTVGSENPATVLGGSWAKLTGGVLACAGTAGYAAAGSTGGSKKIGIAQMPSHTHEYYGYNSDAGTTTLRGSYPPWIAQDKKYNWGMDACRATGGGQITTPIAAEQTIGALGANTVRSSGKIRTFGSPEGTSRMRTGPRTFPSICGGAPRDLCGAMPL